MLDEATKYTNTERQRTAGGNMPADEVQIQEMEAVNQEMQCKLQHMEKKNQGFHTMFDAARQKKFTNAEREGKARGNTAR